MENRGIYESLAAKVAEIIKEVLDVQGIEYHTVTYRAKEIDRFKDKAMKDKYTDPIREIKDLAGIRITTYVESEVSKVVDKVEDLFEIDWEHSIDKSKALGINKVGYRSVHYVAKFTPQKCELLDYKRFLGLEFEIQIRTILEHAWAEIEHDRNYKFSGVLPDQIQRRFAILAGVLELADKEFDRISLAIDSYKNEISEMTKEGDLDVEINTTALREFLFNKLALSIAKGILRPVFGHKDEGATETINEIKDFGIMTIEDLNKIIPKHFDEKLAEIELNRFLGIEDFLGLVRAFMIAEDPDKYFEKVWKGHWTLYEESPIDNLLGTNVEELLKKYNIEKVYIV